MKLKLTTEQKRDFDKARFFFDIGNFKECDAILQTIHPLMSHDKLKWAHDEETSTKTRAGAFIVVKPNGYLVERDRILLHQTNAQAIEYGKTQEGYGFGHYRILEYCKWKNTTAGKYHRRLLKWKERARNLKQTPLLLQLPPSERPKLDKHEKFALKRAEQVLKTPDTLHKTQTATITKREARDTINKLKGKRK